MMRYVGILVVASFCLAGCKKKEAVEETTAAAPLPEKAGPAKELIPGENEVRAAIKNKDYNAAANGVMGLQALLASSEQKAEWGALYQEVRDFLEESARKDPKAAEALATFRAMRMGR